MPTEAASVQATTEYMGQSQHSVNQRTGFIKGSFKDVDILKRFDCGLKKLFMFLFCLLFFLLKFILKTYIYNACILFVYNFVYFLFPSLQ